MFDKTSIRKRVMATIDARIKDAQERYNVKSIELGKKAEDAIEQINLKLESDKEKFADELVKEIIG